MVSEEGPLDKLIAIEWDVIYDLQRQLDSDLSHAERVKLSNSLAYHVNTLNRLLAKKGGEGVDEESLAEVIVGVHRRISRAVVGRIRRWIRRGSSRR